MSEKCQQRPSRVFIVPKRRPRGGFANSHAKPEQAPLGHSMAGGIMKSSGGSRDQTEEGYMSTRRKDQKSIHNPSQGSIQRWDNEGGAIKGVRAKRPRDPV